MKTEDEGIRAVRDVRKAISAEFDDDPEKLIEHYIMVQERHQDRRLRSLAAQQGDAGDDAARHRDPRR